MVVWLRSEVSDLGSSFLVHDRMRFRGLGVLGLLLSLGLKG